MRPLSDERGSVVVLTALAITALTGMVAFVARYGEGATQDVEIQSAVDAAALAIAEDCARAADTCSSTGAQAVVRSFLDATVTAGTATIDGISVDLAARQVVIRATAVDPETSSSASGEAVAGWAAPAVVDFCSYASLVTAGTGGEVNVTFDANGVDPKKICENKGKKGADEHVDDFFNFASANVLCALRWAAMGEYEPCTEANLRSYVGEEIVVPLFEVKHNGKWDLKGFRRATLTGYRVGTGWNWPPEAPPCTGTYRCATGIFLDNNSPSKAAKVRLKK